MTKFSVIIPVYNRAHLISETLETVLKQVYSNFEIIIVDDGSKDELGKLIGDKYSPDQRVRYFYKQNEERGAARNYGLTKATGDFAVFFDSDDFMKPTYLEDLYKVISHNQDVRMLALKYNYDNNGTIEYHPLLKKLPEGWYDHQLFLKGNILACNFCIKLKNHSYKPFPSERELASMEDWLFLLANLIDQKIYIKEAIGVTMRQHDERSMSHNQKVIEARRNATDWTLKNISLSDTDKKRLIAWSHYFCGIHQYLDHKRGVSVKEAINAIKGEGFNKLFLTLLAKSIIGRRLIQKLK